MEAKTKCSNNAGAQHLAVMDDNPAIHARVREQLDHSGRTWQMTAYLLGSHHSVSNVLSGRRPTYCPPPNGALKAGIVAPSRVSTGILLVWMCLQFCACALAYEYELEGNIWGEQFLEGGKQQQLEKLSFHLYVRECNWKLHVVPDRKSDLFKQVAFWEYSFDGVEGKSIAHLINASDGAGGWVGAVSNDQIPAGMLTPQVPVAWFALASACYLNDANGKVTPVYLRAFDRRPVEALIHRQDKSPHLPESVIFISTGNNLQNPTPTSLQTNTFTNATYVASEFRDLQSVTLPTKFSLDVFDENKDRPVRRYTFWGEISAFSNQCSIVEFSPIIPEQRLGQIKDLRFVSSNASSIHPFEYSSDKWIGRGDAAMKPNFSNYVDRENFASKLPAVVTTTEGAGSMNASARYFVVFLLVGASVIPLLVWLIASRRKAIAKNQTQL